MASAVQVTFNDNNKRMNDSSVSPTGKRPKLSAEEKAAKELEREEKRKLQEEKRRSRDEERRVKEEERKLKDEERKLKDAERLLREEEKKTKREAEEAVKRAAAEAIERKERSQLRMGNFFKKVEPKPLAVLETEQAALFMPFYLKENARLACTIPKSLLAPETFSQSIGTMNGIPKASLLKRKRCRGQRKAPLRERLQEISIVPLDQRLNDLKYKLLQFQSDVRPAYFGTMTATDGVHGVITGRKPLGRSSKLNYDYDSEADWVEEDDGDAGEDLGDDDDMSVVSKDTYGDDDEDFLDDAGESNQRENKTYGHLIPSILGIYSSTDCAPVQHMALQKLIHTDLPIDPFEDYWEPTKRARKTLGESDKSAGNQLPVPPGTKLCGKTGLPESGMSFPDIILSDFRKAIQGSTLKKAMLVEKLKTEFAAHKVTKKVIESKLAEIASRQGRGQHDIWILL